MKEEFRPAVALGDDHAFIGLQTLAVALLTFTWTITVSPGPNSMVLPLRDAGHFFLFELLKQVHCRYSRCYPAFASCVGLAAEQVAT